MKEGPGVIRGPFSLTSVRPTSGYVRPTVVSLRPDSDAQGKAQWGKCVPRTISQARRA
ncbi:hypothetical protein GCM10007890_33480 [Methylobacterium tardum]|jgi:hypothetical protein|uniref:Uncharacterized protein n=1 Tax=Methylobacterium tardum TaxID=374432 RepID=A0AA37WRL3_9HYPH|nr:hypothetical protein GCM10007890_33480 [Methylobacterium tardum]